MQHYLKDGHEDKQMVFHKGDVVAYNQLFEQKLENFISPLYCASLWPEFELFQPFIARNLLLKSTEIEYLHALKTEMTYDVQLSLIEQKRVRQFVKYVFEMKINKNRVKCIYIKQTFLERV
ncbi:MULTISPECIES: hypothetical protein [Staphylococcus]|jgi:hypothetical protein|uniref:hypothetical protein n=1 Tax=Staphylococcus TaxID=1279 RepID=UPI000E01169F|nr:MULTISPECIES: hypothetical protein [Staphylococcus]MBO1222102.1 hypothetical protein [Staphylococcus nepalensis]MCD8890428.1 hypothetical protein [Staphylococcus nepalensis]MDR5648598.1 hypothetical protein [Staphylococcus nepalensis]SUM71027.1 protein vraC [Staphylococcus nepalensis]SUM96592.1 protein vraC [Staphylococcus nepalensis]